MKRQEQKCYVMKKSYGTVSTPLHNARMASKYLHIGIQTFYRMVSDGEIKPDHYIGKRGFFTEQYLDNIRASINADS